MENGKLETVPPGTVHLDTVRTLHQTVVSLRTALEISKNELKELKEKYQEHSRCIDYTDIIEKLSLENHILRRKIIDSGVNSDPYQNINFEVSLNTPRTGRIDEYCDSEVIIKTASTEKNKTFEDIQSPFEEPAERLEEILEESKSESIVSEKINSPNATSSPVQNFEEPEPVGEVPISKDNPDINCHNFKTRLELLSKFDVKIKVRTIKEGSVISNTTSDSDSTLEDKKETVLEKSGETRSSVQFEEKREHFEKFKNPKGDTINFKSASSENIKMAVPNEAEVKSKADKFDVQVRITSEENLVVKETAEGTRRKDTLNLDVDNLSLRSLSDGDNSVFSEGGTTPIEHNATSDEKQDQENASGNESEEVDDIELIFTTDESKDMSNLQEDLVSIRETEHWAPASASTTHSTPVLIKFHTLDPDFQTRRELLDATKENQENNPKISESSLRIKRVSLPNDKEIRHVGFTEKGSLDLPSRGILKSCDNKSDNMLYRRSPNNSSRRLDSVDSLTGEYNYKGLSFDNTKSSSFELGSSLDVLHREESVDSFHKTRMGHRFSVFAETDISKCGISEDDLASNLNVRRNTCPNPFAYRPLARCVPRTANKPTSRPRPVIYQGYGPRRESAAQTDVSALPPRWTSDGYLAYKMTSTTPTVVPTLPQRTAATRRLTVPDARPTPLQRRTDEARRVLLSDIGFTSMVPELSRSAEPLWTLRRATPAPVPETPHSPLSRYRYRSPCVSVDRSNDWFQQSNASSNRGVPWRGSLPDVRRDDTDQLLQETEAFLRRSIDNLQTSDFHDGGDDRTGHPYIPAEARQLRLGHAVKLITPQGRLAVGRVRYVGLAGGTAAKSGVMIGAEFSMLQYPGIPRNDGTYHGRRYFLTPPQHTALFVPFSKVVMAWAN
ncbi:uncharacterized protein LOC120631049 [Pararge aegeria]|uniref:Jg7905 protein n=1 Tax=Pararge aegeria aegeria TaxID=348720 RepID=A0A8S4R9J3_9NEOP|nr:uncharacterized protein LOC120631049 [Pararge aegeria]CAH2233466.1 jg7905 [Pararge aegeria aegeria]